MSKINQLNELVYSLGHHVGHSFFPYSHLCKVRMQLQAEGTKLNMLQSLGDNLIGGVPMEKIWLWNQNLGTWMVPQFIAD